MHPSYAVLAHTSPLFALYAAPTDMSLLQFILAASPSPYKRCTVVSGHVTPACSEPTQGLL